MNIEVGKMYEVTHSKYVDTVVFDTDFEEVSRLQAGATFVILEFVGEYERIEEYKSAYQNAGIYKMKILTSEGKIGFCSFWSNEIKIVEN